MSGYNYFGPLPEISVGLIEMYGVYNFTSASFPRIAADGNGLIVDNHTRHIDLLGVSRSMPTPNPQMKNGCGIVPVWVDADGNLNTYYSIAFPSSYVSGDPDLGGYVGTPLNGNALVIYNNGAPILTRYAKPSDSFYGEGCGAGEMLVAWCGLSTYDQIATDGGLQQQAWALKSDNFLTASNTFHIGQYNSIYLETTGPGSHYNGAKFAVDKNARRVSETMNFTGGGANGPASFRNGVEFTFNNNLLDYNPYSANFSSNVGGGDYASGNGQIFIPGINAACALYQDPVIGRTLYPRLAQDIYFAALNSSDQNGGGQFFNSDNGGDAIFQNVVLTRLAGRADYALAINQPNLAINQPLHTTTLTAPYPEFGLSTVGFYGSDGSVKYYNFLPFQFATLDIVQSPDLVWVTPAGYVLAVYHSGNAISGNYSLWIGGSRDSYQSGVTNFRLPVQFGG